MLHCSRFIVIIPDNTILLYSLAVILIVILPGILFNCKNPHSHFDFGTPSHFFRLWNSLAIILNVAILLIVVLPEIHLIVILHGSSFEVALSGSQF